MEHRLRMKMVFHGAMVVLLGLLAGFPYALVVTGDLQGSERAWRMAHLEGVLNGLVLLAVAGVADGIVLSGGQARLLAGALAVTGYANVVAAILGASFSVRGLAPGGSIVNTLVYALFMVGVVAVFLGTGLVALGARRPRQEPH